MRTPRRRTNRLGGILLTWVLAAMAALVIDVPAASACTCADPTIEQRIDQADVVFVGQVISSGTPTDNDDPWNALMPVLVDVHTVVKGTIGTQAVLWAPPADFGECGGGDFAAGGLARSGPRVLFASADDADRPVAWDGCGGTQPVAALDAMLEPLPPPDSDQPITTVVSGRFGGSGIAALDAEGEVVAYAPPAGLPGANTLADCGDGIVAELRTREDETMVSFWNLAELAVVADHAVPVEMADRLIEITCDDQTARLSTKGVKRAEQFATISLQEGASSVVSAELGVLATGALEPIGIIGTERGRELRRLEPDGSTSLVAAFAQGSPIADGGIGTGSGRPSVALSPDQTLLAVRERFREQARSTVTLVDVATGSIVGAPADVLTGQGIYWATGTTLVAPSGRRARWSTLSVDRATGTIDVAEPDLDESVRNSIPGPIVNGLVFVIGWDDEGRRHETHAAYDAITGALMPQPLPIREVNRDSIVAVEPVSVNPDVDRSAVQLTLPLPGATLPVPDADAIALATGEGSSGTRWVLLITVGLATIIAVVVFMARTSRTP